VHAGIFFSVFAAIGGEVFILQNGDRPAEHIKRIEVLKAWTMNYS
jgi:hypothetical protein